jgi:lipocalin
MMFDGVWFQHVWAALTSTTANSELAPLIPARLMGDWYEIEAIPNDMERACTGGKFRYSYVSPPGTTGDQSSIAVTLEHILTTDGHEQTTRYACTLFPAERRLTLHVKQLFVTASHSMHVVKVLGGTEAAYGYAAVVSQAPSMFSVVTGTGPALLWLLSREAKPLPADVRAQLLQAVSSSWGVHVEDLKPVVPHS